MQASMSRPKKAVEVLQMIVPYCASFSCMSIASGLLGGLEGHTSSEFRVGSAQGVRLLGWATKYT